VKSAIRFFNKESDAMVFGRLARSGAGVFKRAKGLASNAYAQAHELAPQVHKTVTAARKGYNALNDAGLIDKYAGKHAQGVHSAAKQSFSAYDQLARAAGDVDRGISAMRR
jgi:hypothetical protein